MLGGNVGGEGLSMTYIGVVCYLKRTSRPTNYSNSCKHVFVVNRISLSLIYDTDFRGKVKKDLD